MCGEGGGADVREFVLELLGEGAKNKEQTLNVSNVSNHLYLGSKPEGIQERYFCSLSFAWKFLSITRPMYVTLSTISWCFRLVSGCQATL